MLLIKPWSTSVGSALLVIQRPSTMNLYAILCRHGMKIGGASKPSGLRVRRREQAHWRHRCGDEGKRNDGRPSDMPVARPGIIEGKN